MAADPRTAPLEIAVHEGMQSSLVGIGGNLALAVFKCGAGSDMPTIQPSDD
jgi:hypothetical protein